MDIRDYFIIEELVDQRVYDQFDEKAWRFFDPRLLQTMYFIRKTLDAPITVNDWHLGGELSQRGLRTNISPIVKNKTESGILYLSPHVRGAALDFDVKDMTAIEVRNWLVNHADRLPYKIRLENHFMGNPVAWVHLDVDDEPENPKVYLFNV